MGGEVRLTNNDVTKFLKLFFHEVHSQGTEGKVIQEGKGVKIQFQDTEVSAPRVGYRDKDTGLTHYIPGNVFLDFFRDPTPASRDPTPAREGQWRADKFTGYREV